MPIYIESQPDFFNFNFKTVDDFNNCLKSIAACDSDHPLARSENSDVAILSYWETVCEAVKDFFGFESSTNYFKLNYTVLKLLYLGKAQGYLDSKKTLEIVQRIHLKLETHRVRMRMTPIVQEAFSLLCQKEPAASDLSLLRKIIIQFHQEHAEKLEPAYWETNTAPQLSEPSGFFGDTHLQLAQRKRVSKQDKLHHYKLIVRIAELSLTIIQTLTAELKKLTSGKNYLLDPQIAEVHLHLGLLLYRYVEEGAKKEYDEQAIESFKAAFDASKEEAFRKQCSRYLEPLYSKRVKECIPSKKHGATVRNLKEAIKYGEINESPHLKEYKDTLVVAQAACKDWDEVKKLLKSGNYSKEVFDRIIKIAQDTKNDEMIVDLGKNYPAKIDTSDVVFAHIRLAIYHFPNNVFSRTALGFDTSFMHFEEAYKLDKTCFTYGFMQKFVEVCEAKRMFDYAAAIVKEFKVRHPDTNFKLNPLTLS